MHLNHRADDVNRLTRSQRRRQIGVQPISSSVAEHRYPTSNKDENDLRNIRTSNDTSALSVVPIDALLCEARLNDVVFIV